MTYAIEIERMQRFEFVLDADSEDQESSTSGPCVRIGVSDKRPIGAKTQK